MALTIPPSIMPAESKPSATPAASSPTEPELAATALALLAQPALWPAMRLGPVDAAAAGERPWATYWSTRLDARLPVVEARARYATAFATFGEHGDRVGELLSLAAIIEGFYVDEGPLDPLDPWIDVRLRAVNVVRRDRERGAVRVQRVGPLRKAVSVHDPERGVDRGAPALGLRGVARVHRDGIEPHQRFDRQQGFDREPGRGLDDHAGAADLAAPQVVLREERRQLQARRAGCELAHQRRAASGPRVEQRGCGSAQPHADAAGDHARLELTRRPAVALVPDVRFALRQARGQRVDAMRPVLDHQAQADQTHYWHYLAGLELLRGRPARAVELARTSLDNSAEIGGPTRLATHRLSLGQALLSADDASAALPWLEGACEAAESIGSSLLTFTARLMRGACELRLGRGDMALQSISLAWTEAARRDLRTTAVWWLPDAVAQAAHVALENAIEPAYVRRFVRAHALPGPDPLSPDWPWPLVLRGFGAFEAWRHDAPLVPAGVKAAQRPLDLLRAMLAQGPAPLPVATVMQWLWPESDPAAQRKAFDVALLRLRRMLDDARLLKLEGARISLDGRWCWTDVGALGLLMQRIGAAQDATLEDLRHWAHALLALARGPFLAHEDADWAVAARTRFSQRFVVTVSQLAARIERLDAAAAVELYERALDIEPLAESLSRRLMRLHAQRGDTAEALRAWRACRTMLLVAAGIGPSRETRALAAELRLPDIDR